MKFIFTYFVFPTNYRIGRCGCVGGIKIEDDMKTKHN